MQKNLGLKEIFLILKKRWLLIIVLTLFAGAAGAAVTIYLMTPEYGASTRILVNQSGGKAAYGSDAVATNVELVNTYSELITDPIVLNQVIQKQHLHLPVSGLQNMLDEETSENSQIFTIKITSASREESVHLVNGIAAAFKDQVHHMMHLDNVSLLAPATVERSWLVSPSLSKNLTIALVLGIIVSISLALFLEYMDNSIKEEEDITQRLQLPVIGLISHVPNFRFIWNIKIENQTYPQVNENKGEEHA
ncbi:MAG: Wzz/FepE/Etk N-terminal domain-containing protein [Sporolactobacillus sp.]